MEQLIRVMMQEGRSEYADVRGESFMGRRVILKHEAISAFTDLKCYPALRF